MAARKLSLILLLSVLCPFWMSKLVVQLEFSLSITHMEIESGLAKATRPNTDDISNVLIEECFLTITEGDHDGMRPLSIN